MRAGAFPGVHFVISGRRHGTMSTKFGGDPNEILNRRRSYVRQELGFDPESVVEITPDGLNVRRARRSLGVRQLPCNGLYTTDAQVLLMLAPADCHPIFLFDPEHRAIALVHAGRKEAVGGILRITVEKMRREAGSNPHKMAALIGPGIRSCCYALDYLTEGDERVLGPFCREHDGKIMVDMVAFHREHMRQLELASVLAIPGCTACPESPYFSHFRAIHQQPPASEKRFVTGIIME